MSSESRENWRFSRLAALSYASTIGTIDAVAAVDKVTEIQTQVETPGSTSNYAAVQIGLVGVTAHLEQCRTKSKV